MLAGFPILFLLLFAFVFGGQLGAGLGPAACTRTGTPTSSTSFPAS